MIIGDIVGKSKAAPKKARKSGSSHITQADFTPVSLKLANRGRYGVRVNIATNNAFPPDHKEWTWSILESVTRTFDNEAGDFAHRLEQALQDEDKLNKLLSYVCHLFGSATPKLTCYPPQAWGGAAQMRGELKTIAKFNVALFGIPGNYSPSEIKDHVAWLLGSEGPFKFGGIDLEVRQLR